MIFFDGREVGFMFPGRNKFKDNSGFSLIQLIVGAAIGAVVMSIASNYFRSYTEQKWVRESQANARMQKEIIANFLRAKVPVFITALSLNSPLANAAVWNCPNGGPCNFRTDNTNGIRLQVRCESVAKIPILSNVPFNNLSSTLGANCAKCGAGTRPIMTMQIFSNGSLTKTQRFPDPNVDNKIKDLVGMGMCFDAPKYQENTGTAAAPNFVDRWDRWKITLVPYFFKAVPYAKDKSDQLLQKLTIETEHLMLAPNAQLGPGMRIIR